MKCIFALPHAKYIECRKQKILREERETEASMEKGTFSFSCSSEQNILYTLNLLFALGRKRKV